MVKVSSALRDKFYICGLPEDLRGTEAAINYVSGYSSESEYMELYNEASEDFRVAADKVVARVKREFRP